MRITKVIFKNFCQHKSYSIEFSPQLNCIKGPIGSGKSNILNGIVGCLTNDFSRNTGIKADNINQLAAKQEESYVDVYFEHCNEKLRLFRSLRPVKQQLYSGNNQWTRAEHVENNLEKILGVTVEMLNDYVFVAQWHIFDFLAAKESDRAKTFQQLFGTMKSENLWKLIDSVELEEPVSLIDADKIRSRLLKNNEELKKLENEYEEFSYISNNWYVSSDPDQEIINAFNLKENLFSEINNIDLELEKLLIDESALIDLFNKLTSDYELIKDLIENSKTKSVEAQRLLQQWNNYEKYRSNINRLTNELKIINEEFAKHQKPEKPENYISLDDEDRKNIGRWESELERIKRYLKYNPSEPITCPECGSESSDKNPQTYKQYQVDCDLLESTIHRYYLNDEISRIYDQKLKEYIFHQQSHNQTKTIIESQLNSFEKIEQPSINKQDLQNIIHDHDEYKIGRDYIISERSKLDKQLSSLRTEIKLKDEIKSKKHEQYLAINITERDAKSAATRLAKKIEDHKYALEINSKINALKINIAADERSFEEFEKVKIKSGKIINLKNHLDEVRQVFHRNNLPQRVAQNYLKLMEDDINSILESFYSQFKIKVADGLKFIAYFKNGVKMPAERLSGGEKVIFSLAFRIIVNSLFVQGLGLLCLDEPTAGLHEENLSCLDVALSRLRELSQSRGLQVILVTHEKVLDSIFDKVIDLSQATI